MGYLLRILVSLGKRGSLELEIKRVMLTAKEEALTITTEAENKATEILEEAKNEIKERENRQRQQEERLIKKEEALEKKELNLNRDLEKVKISKSEIIKGKELAEKKLAEAEKFLSQTTSMSPAEAKKALFTRIEEGSAEDLMRHSKKLAQKNKLLLEEEAKKILSTTIQRLASRTVSQLTTTQIPLENEELKGKIIGKDGRNIKTLERVAGVDILIDDTPNTLTISTFDPIRRAIAKRALERLIEDGRIQPAKIEEAVKEAREKIKEEIYERGQAAANSIGLYNLDPKLLTLLGRLNFRTSFGQNVLTHSLEMARLSGMLAEELGGNVMVAKMGALFHDIGKALDHEVEGTHVNIGRKILEKFGVDRAVILAMQSHHEEYPYENLEAVIVQTADAISAGRPGARSDTAEIYLDRLKDLENLAKRFSGVSDAYALQAGREIRVFVSPEKISDLSALNLAKEISLAIEKELTYPGEIKITVIRETKSITYAR